MRITNLSRSIFEPFGSVPAPVPGTPVYSFVAPDQGTLITPPGGPESAAAVDPDAGTLIGSVTVDADAGTLIVPAGGCDPDAGTLIIVGQRIH